MASKSFAYEHLTTSLHHVPMAKLRNKIQNAKPKIYNNEQQARRIHVYKNGDKHFKGIDLLLSPRTIKTWNQLLEILTDRLRSDRPLCHIYDMHGRSMTSLSDFESLGEYVASHGAFKRGIVYNKQGRGWTNKPPLWGRRGSDHDLWRNRLLSGPASGPASSRNSVKSLPVEIYSPSGSVNEPSTTYKNRRPLIFINSKNMNEKIQVRLNQKGRQDISDVTAYVCDAMKLRHSSTAYITSKLTNRPVTNISQLFNKINGIEFLVHEGASMTKEFYSDVTTGKHARDVYTMTSPEPLAKDVSADNRTNIRLEWVYGGNVRHHTVVTSSGELVFSSGTLVVLYDVAKKNQRFYTGHSEDVTCLAVHPENEVIASSQRYQNGNCHVRIWDSTNLALTSHLGEGLLRDDVTLMDFSKHNSGKWLMTVDRYQASIWNWNKEYLMQNIDINDYEVRCGTFIDRIDAIVMFGGKNILLTWSCEQEDEPQSVKETKYVTSMTSSNVGDVIVGDIDGNIQVLDEYFIRKAHEGEITSLLVLSDGTLLSGGADGYLASWDFMKKCSSPKSRKYFDTPVNKILPRCQDSLAFVYVIGGNDVIWIGCMNHEWNELRMGVPSDVVSITEISNKTFCVCDATGQISSWNMTSHSCFQGRFDAFDLKDGSRIASRSVITSSNNITCIKFSPLRADEETRVAIASDNRIIHVFRVLDEGRAYVSITKFTGNFDIILTMDWSDNGDQLRTQSSDDIVTLNVSDASQIHTSSDITWATHHCTCSGDVIIRDSTREFDVIAEGRHGGNIAIVKREQNGNVVYSPPFKCSSSDLSCLSMTSQWIVCGGKNSLLLQWSL